MKFIRLPSVLIGLSLLAALVPARAATLNVPSQYPTIQAGINAARGGDTVLVADGTYTGPGNVDLLLEGAIITVKSAHGPLATIIDCQGTSSHPHRAFYYSYQASSTDNTVSGFTIKNAYAPVDPNDDGLSGAISISNTTATISNCIFTGNAGNGLDFYSNNDGFSPIVNNCTFTGNGGDGVYISSYRYGSVEAFITNCIFNGNMGAGIEVANTGVLTYGGGFAYNVNCTVTGNRGGGLRATITGYDDSLPQKMYAQNCILYGDVGSEITVPSGASPGDVIYSGHCDVQGGFVGEGNFNADPLFVNSASADFHLQTGSPCIGAGVLEYDTPLTDYDGATRLSPPSIGAYDRPAHTWDATAVAVGPDGLTRLLWANMDGRNSAWTLRGGNAVASSPILQPGSGWTAKDISQDGQGSTHVLWANPDGRMTVWTIKGSSITSLPIFQPGDSWAALSLSVDPQGNAHVLWFNNDTHKTAVWTITPQGAATSTPLYMPGHGYKPIALAEDAQGRTHLLWFNFDGNMSVWTIDASNNVTSTSIFQPGGNWEARKVSVDSQGNNRVLWINTDGRMSVWTIDSGNNVKSTPIYQPGSGWAAQGLAVDSAGSSRVLWDNVDGRTAVWTIPAQGAVTSTPIYQP